MLARANHLRGQIKAAFFQQAKKKAGTFGVCYYQLDNSLECPKIAIITPKKYFRLSTQRHVAKRHFSVLIQKKLASFPPGKYVFILHQAI
ncbi:MAG: ribonuclease P protein component [bacterium]|nr:ribonuclease P protein component [bacterium]